MATTHVDVSEGFRLGPYTLVAQLGRGAFAPVWLARELWGQTELRTVAIKLFAPGAGADADGAGRDRALDEARALCRVEHPNIVRFYAVAASADGALLGLVMEHAQGLSLERRLSQEGTLSVQGALSVASAVASALAAVHAVGLVHRDVKPANVIEANGQQKLIDFGIALGEPAGSPAVEPEAGAARVVVVDDIPLEVPEVRAPAPPPSGAYGSSGGGGSGTIGYMDPASLHAAATPSSDLYSLGATLFHCLTGQLPAAAATRLTGDRGLSQDVLEGRKPAPSLAKVKPEMPDALVKLVDALLDPEPSKRPRSAEAVAWELERIRREFAGRARPLPPEEIGPFRGLGRFEAADRDVYFGRTAEIAAALEMTRTRGLLALVGPSGSGKSSLARAGVLPAICDGELGAWPQRWDAIVVSPGADPWGRIVEALGIEATSPDALADALGGRVQSTGRGVVLLVDQLEELVTTSEPASRDKAAELLVRLALRALPGVRCVVAVRRDLLAPLLELGSLGRALTRGTMLVSPMTRATWGEVIEQALSAYGYKLESEALRSELLTQLEGTVDAMPLVEFALTELWGRRDREARALTRAALAEIGGVAGALERHAERVRRTLIEPDASLASVLYTVVMATTTAQGTRALVPEKKLRASSVRAHLVIELLERERLFVREGEAVTLAHEALLLQWTRLRRWVDEARADRLLAEEIERDADAWGADRAPERLWRKRRLDAGTDLEKGGQALSSEAAEFLAAGRSAEQRGKRLAGGAAAALVLGLGLGAGKYFQDLGRAQAEAEARAHEAQRASASAQLAADRARAVSLEAQESEARAQAAGAKVRAQGEWSKKVVIAVVAAVDDCVKLQEIAARAQRELAAQQQAEPPPPPDPPRDFAVEAIGKVPGADRVIASLGPAFRACYQAGLEGNHAMQGRVVLTARIAETGEVLSVQPSGSTLSAQVVSCAAKAVQKARFAAPEPAGIALLPIPLNFLPGGQAPLPKGAPPRPAVGNVQIGAIDEQR